MLAATTNRRPWASLEEVAIRKEDGMDVAVLGMGRMGRAIAGRLLEDGHRVTVWNRSPGRVAELVSSSPSSTSGPDTPPSQVIGDLHLLLVVEPGLAEPGAAVEAQRLPGQVARRW